jgi:uncharacterized surface anchored protein
MRFRQQILGRCVALIFALTLPFASHVYAQVTTGDINFRVIDTQGQVVSGATVIVTNKGTGQTRTGTTNEAGELIISQLQPGTYDVSVEAKNFSKSVLRDYQLNVGSKQTLAIELKPGEVPATVECRRRACSSKPPNLK